MANFNKPKRCLPLGGEILLAVLLAASCVGYDAPADDTLVVAFETAPGTLDPRYGIDAYSARVRSLTFASLLRIDDDGGYRPWLARSIHCDHERNTCTFELRQDVLFHDGSPLTAYDVAATYQTVLDPARASPKRATLENVLSVAAESRWTVRFELSHDSPSFEEAATLGILPRSLASRPGNGALSARELIGAGPYAFESFPSEDILRLTAFDRYFDGCPGIPRIEIRVVPDALMRAMELRHGSVHLVQNAIDPDTVDWLEEQDENLQVIRAPTSNHQYLGFNFDHPTLADIRVRRAIALGIDRDAIVSHLLAGQARPASGLLPPEHWAFDGNVHKYRYNPRRARKLLDAAGYHAPGGSGPRFTLSYKTTTQALRHRIAEAIARQLEDIGIQLDVRTYEWGTFFADIRSGNFDMYSLQWVGIVDPDLYRQIFHSTMTPPAGKNRGHFVDKRIDRLTERGAAEGKITKRKAIYARIQRHAAIRLPYVPLWWPERIVVATKRLKGFKPHPAGDLLGLAKAHLAQPKH